MTLIKTGLLNTVAVAVRMLSLLCINKVLALFVGPDGYAALGQFQNLVQVANTIAGGGINTALTKYTAEFHEDENKQVSLWQTAGSITLIFSLLVSPAIFFSRDLLATLFLHDSNLSIVFGCFSVSLVPFVFNNFIISIVSGKKYVTKYVFSSVAGSVLALIVTAILVVLWGLVGALISLTVYQSFALLITVLICRNEPWFRFVKLIGKIETPIAKNIGRFAVMSLCSAAVVPTNHIITRTYITSQLGLEAAGHWEAMSRLSSAYSLLASTTFTLYYLPRLSELRIASQVRREIVLGFYLITPLLVGFSLALYLIRDPLIIALFSLEFLPMGEIFAWQLVGDCIKILSWLLGTVLTAKAMVGPYVLLEICFVIVNYLLITYTVPVFGLKGVGLSHTAVYALSFIATALVLKGKKIV